MSKIQTFISYVEQIFQPYDAVLKLKLDHI